MSIPLRLLLVEDLEDDALLLLRELRRGGYKLEFERVDTSATMLAALSKDNWNLIVCDYSMPQFSALAALKLLHSSGLDLPFIIVSGTIGEDTAVAAMKAGAHDYMMKGNLARLIPAVERELREAEIRQARRQTEEQLKASLQEKEVLLQEIHHRVKNNLQIVSSLLNLQATYLQDEQALEIFKVSQNRIESMALVHEKLYQSQDLANIDFDEYVQELVTNLYYSYKIDSNAIDLKVSSDRIFLKVDVAIPCGLIINELVLNSLKYAFSPGRKGKVYVEFRVISNNEFALTIGDDGIGLPSDLDWQNTSSLGLQIVNSLVEQLAGTIKLNNTSGTEYIIRFTA